MIEKRNEKTEVQDWKEKESSQNEGLMGSYFGLLQTVHWGGLRRVRRERVTLHNLYR